MESADASDRFLWDLRRTISDLVADAHYDQIDAILHAWGMGRYGESHETGRAFIGDGMQVKRSAEVPMAAMWAHGFGAATEPFGFDADDRESASVAHIYGQNVAAAESFTAFSAPYSWTPAALKPIADRELVNGINRFVIHESTHQPRLVGGPGLALGPFGQWFNRNETWAEAAGSWLTYLARSSYLLQQGRAVADVVYFYGEDSNLTAIFAAKTPEVPDGFGFDFINADGVLHALSVKDGAITAPSGMSYHVLYLDPYSSHMSLPVLSAIRKLVEDGAVLVGQKPLDDPSLADDPATFRSVVDELFGDGTTVHRVGKGTVYVGGSLADALRTMELPPDFEYTKPSRDTRLFFAHRHLMDGDVYFVDNRGDREEVVDATFRVSGRAPELWFAETGRTEPASYRFANGRTTVPLHLEPFGALFVVFRKPMETASRVMPRKVETTLTTVEGPWDLTFQSGRGAPGSIHLNELTSWSVNQDPGVRYFSGEGTYTRRYEAAPELFAPNARLWLDLGDVKNIAEVTINGKAVGEAWHPPYRIDVTETLHPGSNEVSIKVINTWVNRLIGDQQPGATAIAYTTRNPYKADSPLLPSGLLGPVRIVSVSVVQGG